MYILRTFKWNYHKHKDLWFSIDHFHWWDSKPFALSFKKKGKIQRQVNFLKVSFLRKIVFPFILVKLMRVFESTERVYFVFHADYTVLRDSTRCLPEGRVIPVEPSQPSVWEEHPPSPSASSPAQHKITVVSLKLIISFSTYHSALLITMHGSAIIFFKGFSFFYFLYSSNFFYSCLLIIFDSKDMYTSIYSR